MRRSALLGVIAAVSFAAAPVAAATNLVVNGSFESGDFTGWIQGGDTSFTFVTSEAAGGGPTEGIFHAALGPVDDHGVITQFLPTTPGAIYRLSFDIASLGGPRNEFVVFWDGDFQFGLVDSNPFDYITVNPNVIASGNSTELTFTFINPPSFWLLDNVSVTATPEPAGWGLMMAGFAIVVGAAMRRRPALIA